ncbi:uncharacterized protein LOC108118341 isoform X5 [Drosophila eugracilis]|uniref:uncharacterized protein LOC108118341 isoform X5 n=1 Tax=Drosophila eugracilis TaxID=29029 RepID=UPI001BDA7B22|nr:uncharacterized protein LOC108118341 isoform X5 [Drosophila eugracilis]
MVLRRLERGIPKTTHVAYSTHKKPLLVLLLSLALVGRSCAQVDTTISQLESQSVVLPCPVNIDKCGQLHSLNWFKGDNRIAAMLLGDSNVTNVNKQFDKRVTVEQNPYRLVIKDLKIDDEDIYLCDTTFFIPEETCDNFNGYRIELRVLENIVPPTEVVILDAKGDRIENGSVVGPMQERQSLKATCTVKNTRPQPEVAWFRGTKRLTTYSPTHDISDGLYTSTLELDWPMSREDLAQDIECRVKSAAIPNTTVTKFSVDLQVRPISIDISGLQHHTVQGSKVVLTCDIHGARPAVNLTWYNSSTVISADENDLTEIRIKSFEKNDGTYHTQSELIFNATRFENDRVFRCEAENVVLQINREKPISSALTLEVLYPPVVKVSPTSINVNTSEVVLLNCEYVANPASLTHVEWYRNDDLVNVNVTNHYKGGNSENVALVIKSAGKEDIGNYSCELSNTIGKGTSNRKINLDVQYVPSVEILMIPEGPVKESEESNVTLFCNVLDANPLILTKVRWYANSTLLKELPDCEETREDLCHIDPSKLLLESIGRGFFYNYSCEGFNSAGWGPRSEDKELMVHYEPGPAILSHFPLVAVKKKSVTFSCSVDDPGYPDSNRFRWLRGGRGPLQDIVTKDWTVEPVGLDSRTNYSCYAYNEGGKGVMATVNLEVHAPPFFIKNLPPYTGMLHSSSNATLTCRIECVPRCEISWQKDGDPIERNDTRYIIKEKYMEASPATGDFESMLSVLHFNMPNWPNAKFDIEADNANYTCVSSSNTVGGSIRSRTYFGIEFAPDNTTVSKNNIYVQEDTLLGRVTCNSRANPEPSYKWFFKNETISNEYALSLNKVMKKTDNGTYTCLAYNKHGSSTAETIIIVQFKPRCEIERREIDDQDTLICTAYGNPVEVDFAWSIKAENESVETLGSGDKKTFSEKSFYVLETDYAISRTYRCVANNTIGFGQFCEIEVAVQPKKQLAWWQLWETKTIIILLAAIFGLLLTVIIICCIIILICRRRRRQDKYLTDVSISATQSVLSNQSEIKTAVGSVSKPDKYAVLLTKKPSTRFNGNESKLPPRWPIRPGVMVHVSSNTKENLTVNRMTLKPNIRFKETNKISAEFSEVLRESQSNDSTILTNVSVDSDKNEQLSVITPRLDIKTKVKKKELPLDNLSAKTAGAGHKKLNYILGMIFKKTSDDCSRKSQRSHIGLLQTYWRRLDHTNSTSQFGTQHRLKGIRCSRSVTYKKANETTHGKSSTAADAESPLTKKLQKVQGIACSVDPSDTAEISFEAHQNRCPILHLSPTSPALPLRSCQNLILSCSANSTLFPSSKFEHAQMHDKSSSLGEPLTEPGEYENLPFHGLQTAPNKYSTIRINFNNNKNAEPMVQQPKKLNENINQTWINHKHDRQTIPDQHTYQQGNINEQELQYVHRSQYNTTHRQLITDLHNQRLTELVTDRPVQQSTSSCFPNSYTEYYRQHQEQKIQIQMRGEEHQLMDVNSLSNSQLLNALENDCISTNTAIDRPERSALLNTNPFLAATNFNKLCDEVPESIISANHSNSALHLEDKFNSLRFPNGNKFKNRTHIENSLLGSTTSQSPSAIDMSYLSTCKRHNSFAYIDPNQQSTHFHDSPNYENMVDENTDDQSKQTKKNESNQNLTTILLHTHPATDKFKKHYRSQHIKQQKNDEGIGPDFQLIEPERITIYRSDSGISNSSYESQFPPLSQKRSQKKKRDIVNSFSGPSVRKHIYKKNIGAQNSAMIHDDSTNGDKSGEPIGNVSISLSYKPSIQYIDKTNQEDLRQQQLGHHGAISTSMHSICKSLKVTKVKTSIEKTQSLAVNTFLATNGKSNALSGNKKKKKLRRQTISSPYEQIQRHPYARRVKNCDVSREILGYSSEVHSSAQKFDSRDLQIASANDLLIRPIRLPLRKHHSFNYQSTQTANGKLQQLRMQLHLQLQERKEFKEEGTPLVLQLSERHAFKPISPTPIMTKSEEQQTRDHSQTGLFSQYSCRHNLKAAEDDEDPGYSFFEEDNIVDNGNYPTSDNLHTAPANSSSTWNAIENRTAGDS